MHKSIQIAFLSLFICFEGNSQFFNYDIQNGLSSHDVDFLCEDDEGYIYAATGEGLNVFNGSDFKTYNQYNTSGFSNKITTTLPIKKGYVLIGSRDKGLFLFDKFNDVILPLSLDAGKTYKNISVASLALSKDHNSIWIGCEDGMLFTFKVEDLKTVTEDNLTIESIKVTDVQGSIRVIQPLQDYILIGGERSFITRIGTVSNNYIIDTPITIEGVTSVHTIDFVESNLFIGTNIGLYKIENFGSGARHITNTPWLLDDIIIRTATIHNTFIWVGTEGHGLYKFSFDSGDLEEHYTYTKNKKNGLNSKYILSSLVDSNNNLWIGTWLGGMYVLDLKSYNHTFIYDSESEIDLFSNIVWAIAKTPRGKYYMGTHGNDLVSYDYPDKNFTSVLSSKETKSIPSIYWDDITKLLFMGTWENGVKVFDTDKDRLTASKLNLDTVRNDRIYAITRGPNKQLWIGTFEHGLYRFSEDKQVLEKINLFENTNDKGPNIKYLLSDVDLNSLWVATAKQGIFKISLSNSGAIEHIATFKIFDNTKEKILPESLYKDTNGTLWIACRNGIGFLKDNITRELPLLKGFVSTGIISDTDKNLWTSTYKGLYKISKDTLSAKPFLKDHSFYDLFYDSEQHTILAGSNHGLLKMSTRLKEDAITPPKVLLSDLKILGQRVFPNASMGNVIPLSKKLNYCDSIILPHFAQTFSVDLNAISANKVQDYKLRYRLKGFEKIWNETSNTSTTSSYTNVPSGNYELQVQVSIQENVWLPLTRNLTIIKEKPWWNTFWAFLVYLLLSLIITIAILKEIRDRTQIKKELEIKKITHDQERELNEQKLAFFTNLSHDLRTPLTLIMGPIEEILDSHKIGEKTQVKLQRTLKNSKMLLNLVNQILNFRKAETEHLTLNIKEIELNVFIRNIYNQFHELAQNKLIDFELSLSDEEIILSADSDKLESIFFNLISNAIKFTPRYGHIGISTQKDENFINITVQDTGIGISQNDINNIFNRFFRAKNNREQGTGIGLALTKKYVDVHGGHIEIKSTLNIGTEFNIRFPVVNSTRSGSNSAIQNSKELPSNASLSTETSTGAHKKPNVLIVDDSKDIREYLSEILNVNYNLYTAKNGKEGLAITNKRLPDLIVSDVMMDTMDGIEMCGLIKSNVNTSHIPIILLTAKNSIESKLDSFQKGADAYIEKPFNSKLLLTRIEKIIEHRRRLKKKFLLSDNLTSAEAPTSVDEEFIKKIIKIIEENFSDPQFSVKHLTEKLNLSQDQVYRKIKGLTGLSINHFIRLVRLKKAASLLKTCNHTISEVLFMVGFNNPSYFTKCFKDEFGVLPSDFAKIKTSS
ncbi:response regulator [Aureibaculum sp. 2210JD6-5]|uniref:hybrid sensor histidine kinase/response regulator transcription factor n=1 Tax=Aureibaculum sp. 2210JD6-5 TaxID=3103957 RepID=UPI002AAD6283|nr:ATP-binding protein [Aureibaculum sp. 2210JD6-5]MDY7396890.1 response regulator [Aureibaculum sp. 2210JD6-5]